MMKLSDHKQYENNPFFYKDIFFHADNLIYLSSVNLEALLGLTDYELKAFLIMANALKRFQMNQQRRKLIFMYHDNELLEFCDISKYKSREVTLSLIARQMIARAKGIRNTYFMNPKYIVDLGNEPFCFKRQWCRDEDGKLYLSNEMKQFKNAPEYIENASE